MPRDTNDRKLYRKNPYLFQGALVGASSTTINLNTNLGRNAESVTFIHDGTAAGDADIELSYDGTDFSAVFPVSFGESITWTLVDVHSIRVTRPADGADFIFRIMGQ